MGEKPLPLGEDFSAPVRAKVDYRRLKAGVFSPLNMFELPPFKAGGIRAPGIKLVRGNDLPVKLSP